MPLLRTTATLVPLRPAPRAQSARLQGSRRPHDDATVEAVRRLVEDTPMTFAEMEAATGVGRATICRWTRDQKWQRPYNAARATDTVPRVRAGRKLKLRLLAERLLAVAERCVRDLERNPNVRVGELMEALQAIRMARLDAMGGRQRRLPPVEAVTGELWLARQRAIETALRDLRNSGIWIDHAPGESIRLALEPLMPIDDCAALHPRGPKRKWW